MITTKRFILLLLFVFVVVLIPLITMQFTKEVNWSLLDFIIAGTLLFGTGLIIDFIIRKVKSTQNRIIIISIIFILLILLWAELAVGIFDSPIAGN